MTKKLIGTIFILIFISIFSIFYLNKSPTTMVDNIDESKSEENITMSNIIEDVEYSSKDATGNEYTIRG